MFSLAFSSQRLFSFNFKVRTKQNSSQANFALNFSQFIAHTLTHTNTRSQITQCDLASVEFQPGHVLALWLSVFCRLFSFCWPICMRFAAKQKLTIKLQPTIWQQERRMHAKCISINYSSNFTSKQDLSKVTNLGKARGRNPLAEKTCQSWLLKLLESLAKWEWTATSAIACQECLNWFYGCFAIKQNSL